jgi:hypothetical protein
MSELRNPGLIRRDIESSRQELGDAVETHAAKANVKAMARTKLEDAQGRASASTIWHAALQHRVLIVGAGALLTIVVV